MNAETALPARSGGRAGRPLAAPDAGPPESERTVAVAAEGVTRRHRGGTGVFDVSLTVAAGEVVSLVGPAGSGKTTLVRALAGLDPIDEGSIRWFGRSRRDDPAVRRGLGVVLDGMPHFDQMTGYQNAWFLARRFGVDERQARGRLNSLFSLSRLGSAAHRPVSTYTRGMRQRLGLVEGLAHAPRLLLLDEPAAGLDPDDLAVVADVVERASRSGVGVLVSTGERLYSWGSGRTITLSEGRVARPVGTGDAVSVERER